MIGTDDEAKLLKLLSVIENLNLNFAILDLKVNYQSQELK